MGRLILNSGVKSASPTARIVGGMDHDETVRLYGPWRHRTVPDVVDLFRGYCGRWWIAGGWAIEAFTGKQRVHGDIDPSIPSADVPLLCKHLHGRLDVWAAHKGTLRPLVFEADSIPKACSNLWLRVSGAAPWEFDVTLMNTTAEQWTYKRDPRVRLPFADILWQRDGVSYLLPEIQLLYKAPGLRPQDQRDFDASLPLLDETARRWLRTAMETAHPGHPWIAELG